MNRVINEINADKNIKNKICLFSLKRFLYHNTNYAFDHLRSPKDLKFQKTAWNQLRGNFGILCPWSHEVKEDIARALDKYTTRVKSGFENSKSDEVVSLIKNMSKGKQKIKFSKKDTVHILNIEGNREELIRIKFDNSECVDAILDSGARTTAISGAFFDGLNLKRSSGNKKELQPIIPTKFSAANGEALHARGTFNCEMQFLSTIGENEVKAKGNIVVQS